MNLTDSINPLLPRRLTLFVQANMPLTDEDVIVSPQDLTEIFIVMNEAITDMLAGHTATFINGSSRYVGGINRYKDDEKHNYDSFWKNVEDLVVDTIETTIRNFRRDKFSTGAMIIRFNDIIVPLIIEHLRKFHPDIVLVGSPRFFGGLADFCDTLQIRNHPDDIRVARATMSTLQSRIKKKKKK